MPTLDPDHVPYSLRHLISLAERWGVGDDYERDAAVEAASAADRAALVAATADAPDELWTWLGADAASTGPSTEYIAFTCLTMAADYARVMARRNA